MNILIACDSFKDALDAPSVCRAIEKGLLLANPLTKTRIFPLSDGGEGLSDILNFHLGLKHFEIEVHDPLFRKVQAHYSLSADGTTAFIEMAQAAGLQRLSQEERNPLKTTTFGVGEMIKDAIKMGATHIILGIGGSATNDLGIGMASALGWRFLDKNNNELLPVGENLKKIEQIFPPFDSLPHFGNNSQDIQFEVLNDVKNPLLGKNGAANVYARQKGANTQDIEALEQGAGHFSKISNWLHGMTDIEGAGAAGGLGFGAILFLGASLKSGIEVIMDLTAYDQQVAWADIIFTGEGKLDQQTANGKLITGIISRSCQKPVIALCGALEVSPQFVNQLGLTAAFSIAQKPCSLQEALDSTEENLEKTAYQVGKILL